MRQASRALRIRFLFWRRCYRLGIAFRRFGQQCEFNARDARRLAAAFSEDEEAEGNV